MMGRDPSMDAARGLAVAGMIFMHLVPLDGIATWLELMIEGTAAALFFVLVGMSWAIQADRTSSPTGLRQFALRRTVALLILGLMLHVFLWPTEVLIPFGIMLAPALWVRSKGPVALTIGIVALLTIVLLGANSFSTYAEADWLENGSHLADTKVGWITLRYLLFDGNYPLIPWMVFPCLGMLLFSGQESIGRLKASLVIGLGIGCAMGLLTFWTDSHAENLGPAAIFVATSWVPTTLPFVLMKGGMAVSVVAGLSLWHRAGGLPKALARMTFVGRASLTHYLAHICLVFVPLRLLYPGEDWPLWVGLGSTIAYLVLGIPLSIWWFKRHKRGPLEQIVSRFSGGVA